MRFCIAISIVSISLVLPMQSFAIGSNLDLTACLVSNIGKVTTDSQDNANNLSIEAGSIQAELGGRVDIQEKIKVTLGLSTITAEEASYDETAGVLQIPKSVVFENPDLIIFGESAKLLTKEKTTIIDGADYQILSIPARGTASQIRVENGENIELDEVTYSTCTSVDNSWELSAKKIVINNQSGEGEARNLVLRFKDIPIIYLPYLSFPINDQRKTGLLVPNLGRSSKRGLEISLPYYWNLAPNIDLTTTPTLMAKRGVQLSAELRFLTAIQGGITQIDYLPNDDKYKKDRTYISHRQTINLPSNWRMKLNGEYASDNSYFEDLTGTMSSTSRTHLLREIQLEHYSENWIMEIGMDHYQMIDDSIIDEEKPYRRLPYFNFSGMWGNKALGLNYALDSEVVFFDKPETISGSRFHVMPEVSAPLNFNGIKITPSMAMDFTKYNLHNANVSSPISNVSPERAVPIYSLDLTGVFQKTWKNGRYLQTLEPRILRVYVPYRNQDDFPIFDTIVPDMNGIQLFRKNRYVGQDRLGDTSQISYGITTKVVDANNGNSLFGLTLGQIRYFKDRKVALPSESKLTQDSSGYMAMMNMKINKNWSVKLGHMWNTHSNTSMKTTARFQYKSKQSEIFNVAYRYRRNMLKQLDASFSWPVRDHWNVVGRYNYSILDRKVLEQFVGLEYESCCWGIRVISRKHLAYRNGDTDTSFSIEFVFKGLSDIGDPVENLLDRGILGYDLE